jgi:hypothetical protein
VDWGKWWELKLRFEGPAISAWVGDVLVVDRYMGERDILPPFEHGMAGFASGYHSACFDRLRIDPVACGKAPISFVRQIDFNGYNNANTYVDVHQGAQIMAGVGVTVNSAITITEIGRMWINRNRQEHVLSIYDAKTGDLCSSGTIHMTNPDDPKDPNYATTRMDHFHGFVYAKAETQLEPGDYYIVSTETIGGDKWYGGDLSLPIVEATDTGLFTNIRPVICIGDPKVMVSWIKGTPTTTSYIGNCYGPINFKYVP